MPSISELANLSQRQDKQYEIGGGTGMNLNKFQNRANTSDLDKLATDMSKIVSGIEEFGQKQYDISVDTAKRMAVDHLISTEEEIDRINSDKNLTFDQKRQELSRITRDKLSKSSSFLEDDENLQNAYDDIYTNKARLLFSKTYAKIDNDEFEHSLALNANELENYIKKAGRSATLDGALALVGSNIKHGKMSETDVSNALVKEKINLMIADYNNKEKGVMKDNKVSDKYLKELFGDYLNDGSGYKETILESASKINEDKLKEVVKEEEKRQETYEDVAELGTTALGWATDEEFKDVLSKITDKVAVEKLKAKRFDGYSAGHNEFKMEYSKVINDPIGYVSPNKKVMEAAQPAIKRTIGQMIIGFGNGSLNSSGQQKLQAFANTSEYGSYVAKEFKNALLSSSNLFEASKSDTAKAILNNNAFFGSMMTNLTDQDRKDVIVMKAISNSNMDISQFQSTDFEYFRGKGFTKEQLKIEPFNGDEYEDIMKTLNPDVRDSLLTIVPALNRMGKTELIESAIAGTQTDNLTVNVGYTTRKRTKDNIDVSYEENGIAEFKQNHIEDKMTARKLSEKVIEQIEISNPTLYESIKKNGLGIGRSSKDKNSLDIYVKLSSSSYKVGSVKYYKKFGNEKVKPFDIIIDEKELDEGEIYE